MKAILFAVASLFIVTASTTPSVARPYYHGTTHTKVSSGHRAPAQHTAHRGRGGHYAKASHGTRYSQASRSTRSRSSHASVSGKPARWCGWWMRTQKGGGPELNLASNWRHWGRASGPRVGAVVVWSHHVGMITGRTAGGDWIVKSGNDGGAVRERPRSVAGAVFRV